VRGDDRRIIVLLDLPLQLTFSNSDASFDLLCGGSQKSSLHDIMFFNIRYLKCVKQDEKKIHE
jgi:hypothetical protein